MKTVVKLFFLVAVAAAPATATAAPPTVSAGKVDGAPGQNVEVPIEIHGAKRLGSLNLHLSFDPAVLEFKSVEQGDVAADDVRFHLIDPGTLSVALYSADEIAGDGAILKVLMHVRGESGQKSPLTIGPLRIWNVDDSSEMLVTGQGGEFSVVSKPWRSPWVWLAIAAVGLIAVGLVAKKRSTPAATRPAAAPARAASVGATSSGAGEAEIPTYGRSSTFKHHCSGCGQEIELPQSASGKQFKCAGCGAVQVAGQ